MNQAIVRMLKPQQGEQLARCGPRFGSHLLSEIVDCKRLKRLTHGLAWPVSYERSDVFGAGHSFLQLWALSRLASIEEVWLLIGKPPEDIVEFGFDRSMPEHQDVLRVDTFLTKQLV